MTEFILILFSFFALGAATQKYKFLLDNTALSKHKRYIKSANKIPVTGGLFLLIGFIILNFYNLNLIYLFFLLLVFSIGFFSDLSNNFSPKVRLLTQIILILIFIVYSDISILDTRINFINILLLNYQIISIIFTLFCILVLINGTNFIDGVNLSTIGYFLLIFFALFYLQTKYEIIIDETTLINLIKITFALLIINYFNKTQLGDGGSYLLAFLTGFLIISFINENKIVSPYYAINLLWYPCLENLFSILRKLSIGKDISRPDNYHLHHLIYLFLERKKIKMLNNISGIWILLFNSIALTLSTYFFYSTIKQLQILFVCILLYISFYFLLKKKLKIKF